MDKDIWRGVKWITLSVGICYLFGSTLQYFFVKAQVNKTVLDELNYSATQINRVIALVGALNFQGIDRARIEAKDYYIFYEDGLLLNANAERSIPGLIEHIDFLGSNELSDMKPKTITSTTGEKWRMLLKKVEGGIVILGISSVDKVDSPDYMLVDNSKYFGPTLNDVRMVNMSIVDGEVDYAVIDSLGNLVSAAGRIPLYSRNGSLRGMAKKGIRRIISDGRSYLVLYKPLLDGYCNPIGTIVVTQDISLEQHALNNQVLFNILFALCSLVIILVVGLLYSFQRKSTKE
jgi:hypothetical protein